MTCGIGSSFQAHLHLILQKAGRGLDWRHWDTWRQNSKFILGYGPRGREGTRNQGDRHSRGSPGNRERTYRKEWNQPARETKKVGWEEKPGADGGKGWVSSLLVLWLLEKEELKRMDSNEHPLNFRYLQLSSSYGTNVPRKIWTGTM